jgi:hypothetical protein
MRRSSGEFTSLESRAGSFWRYAVAIAKGREGSIPLWVAIDLRYLRVGYRPPEEFEKQTELPEAVASSASATLVFFRP